MNRAEKRLCAWALCLTVGALLLSRLKFLAPWAVYQKNKASFDLFSVQLETLLLEIEKQVPWDQTDDPYMKLQLRDGQIASFTAGGQKWEIGHYPTLTETGAILCQAGIYHIDVYDFSGEKDGQGSSCEIWYSMTAGDLIYTANGSLTYSHDPSNWDWGGYRFYQKRLNKNWFIMVSRYDKDSPYWKM